MMDLVRRDWIAITLLLVALFAVLFLLAMADARAESGDASPPTGEIAAGTIGGSSALAGVVSFYTSRIQTNRRVDCIEKKIMVVMGALRFTSPEAAKYIESMNQEIPSAPQK